MMGGIRMNENELNTLGFKAAKDTIQVLKGTVESLQLNLSQERDANEGLQLTIESLKGDNERLQEENFQLQSELQSLKETAGKEPSAEKTDNSKASLQELAQKLSFYYQDMKKVDAKNLTAEDSETLYNILDYTFKTLKKAGLKL
jgi:septation ring formation regulator EzrA